MSTTIRAIGIALPLDYPRKNSYGLYNVTSVYFNDGRNNSGVSGGGFGGYGFMISLENSNNTVAYMLVESKNEFNSIRDSYYQSIDDQFNAMIAEVPMAKDYFENVHPAFEAANDFHRNTSDWTPENRTKYQALMDTYNQALHDFNTRWNE